MKMRLGFIFILISSLFSFSCTQSHRISNSVGSSAQGIISGQPVPQDDVIFLSTVRILELSGDVWYPLCTGSIIADDLVLTAAHCVDHKKPDEIRVAFGAQPLSYDGQVDYQTRVDVLKIFKTTPISSMIVHPDYGNAGDDADMVLLKLNGDLPEGFKPVALMPSEKYKQIPEAVVFQFVIAGYGVVDEDNYTHSDVLRFASLPGILEGRHLLLDQTHGSGGCFGDSGGPAYLSLDGNLFLVGVTRGGKFEIINGVKTSDCHHTGIWGNPNFERDFLNSAAEKLGSAARFPDSLK